jgi:hypothetical protein
MDTRTDLYALGVMVYLMLTGQVPFSGETPPRIMYGHLNETPPPPHKLNPALPPAVEKVLLKMLAKSPDQRYPTAAQFCAELRAALTGRKAKTDPGGPTPRRVPAAAWIGGVLLLLILIGAGLFFWPGGDTPAPAAAPAVNEARVEIDGQVVSDQFQQVTCDTARRLEIKFLDAEGNPIDSVDFSYTWRFEPDDSYNEDKANSSNYATNYQVPCELENQTVTIEAQKDGKTFFTKSLLFDISQ